MPSSRTLRSTATLVLTAVALALCLRARVAPALQKYAGGAPGKVMGENLEQSSRCDKGAPIRVLANESHLSILGDCTVVTVVGHRNWILIEHARRIVMVGNRNTVLYDDRANSVMERWPQ